MCKIVILSNRGATVISQCVECKTLTLWPDNLLLNFTPSKFKTFKNYTTDLNNDKSLFSFPSGEYRFVLRTPHNY